MIPRSALIRNREWYSALKPNVGLKLTAEEVARGIVERETRNGRREYVTYGVLDPAAFAVISGPSIAETLLRNGAIFRRADNQRINHDKRMGGWTELRARLKGNADGHPMIFFMFLSVTVGVMIVLTIVFAIFLQYRANGRNLHAIGGSAEVARL